MRSSLFTLCQVDCECGGLTRGRA